MYDGAMNTSEIKKSRFNTTPSPACVRPVNGSLSTGFLSSFIYLKERIKHFCDMTPVSLMKKRWGIGTWFWIFMQRSSLFTWTGSIGKDIIRSASSSTRHVASVIFGVYISKLWFIFLSWLPLCFLSFPSAFIYLFIHTFIL